MAALQAAEAALPAAAAPQAQQPPPPSPADVAALFQDGPLGETLQLAWNRAVGGPPGSGSLEARETPLLLRPPSLDVSPLLAAQVVQLPTAAAAAAPVAKRPRVSSSAAGAGLAAALASGAAVAAVPREWPEECVQAAREHPEKALAALGGEPSAALAVAALRGCAPEPARVAALVRLGGWGSVGELAEALRPLREGSGEVVRMASLLL